MKVKVRIMKIAVIYKNTNNRKKIKERNIMAYNQTNKRVNKILLSK